MTRSEWDDPKFPKRRRKHTLSADACAPCSVMMNVAEFGCHFRPCDCVGDDAGGPPHCPCSDKCECDCHEDGDRETHCMGCTDDHDACDIGDWTPATPYPHFMEQMR